jgi:arsenate reductase
MAEALMRKYAGDRFEAHSAGLEPKNIHPLAIQVMREKGIDISNQASKGVDTYLGKTLFQYLVTVCDDAEKNCPTVWPGVNQRVHWSFEDPAAFEGTDEEKLAKFREIRDRIEQRLISWLEAQHDTQ